MGRALQVLRPAEAPPLGCQPGRGRIPGYRRRPRCAAQGETMLSVPEFYSRRKQFDGQSSTRLDVSAARSHFLVAGDRKAVLTGTRYTVCRCSRHRIVGAQRDSMGRPGRRLSWSCAPRSARPQADRRLPLAPTVLKSSGAYLPPDRETEGCVVGTEFCLAPHADV